MPLSLFIYFSKMAGRTDVRKPEVWSMLPLEDISEDEGGDWEEMMREFGGEPGVDELVVEVETSELEQVLQEGWEEVEREREREERE